jgi:hypothetical protein
MSTNRTEQFILLKRLLIIFGSICFLWLIIGIIFLSIQTYRHFKKKTNQKLFRYNRSLQLPTTLLKPTLKDNYISDNDQDDDDDRASVFTSVSVISERSRFIHEHTNYITPCQRIPEEQFQLTFPDTAGIANLAYSQSTSSSSASSDIGTSLLYYPACRNFAYSQSTLCSSDNNNYHQKTPTPSLIIPLNNFSSPIHQFNFDRQSSHNSTNTTILSQITNATYVSNQSSIRTIPLPTVMITDVDRLQTDIIELENFEPEKEWYNRRSRLRFLLNDRMPQRII